MLTNLVNFFGHAAVASWHTPEPGTVLGAMLPDFATMSGARIAEPTDPSIAHGIALHHETDRVFHQAPVVRALMRELDERLERGGCARGPRRAVAHIGVELLLDGVLVAEQAYRDAYESALSHNAAGVRWRDDGDDQRFAVLLARMRSHGVPDDLSMPESIGHRLHRMLAHRPLLAPSATDLAAIRTALVDHKPRVEVAAETVLRVVRAGLAPA